ncbi:hypothetical protein LV564_16455 [Komagataeibacter nataicola]|nr:hypothetical protein [Komagataeibacter nataicola]WEQ55632.1 hypothetical protein LV564_16455 [Komagataeibacter nataicola]WNM09497.1 hypothetical protein RI056_05990 [Komagataeibacter nataicola]
MNIIAHDIIDNTGYMPAPGLTDAGGQRITAKASYDNMSDQAVEA